MLYTLQNDWLTVKIEDLGAQLASIQTPDGQEFLWQGSPDSWARRAPILFPVIGRLKNGCYTLGEDVYHISSHGFARDCLFQVQEPEKPDPERPALSFQLYSSKETLRVYPCLFALTVTYSLEENRLHKACTVHNLSDTPMYYELGAHDGFRTQPGDAVVLEGVDRVALYGMNAENMLTPKDLEVSSKLPLTPMRYGRDTMIFDSPGCASLVDAQGRRKVRIQAPDFPYMGVWTPDKPFDTGFVCIEPWSTLPDGEFMGRALKDKPGIRCLNPWQRETLTYTTEIYGGN